MNNKSFKEIFFGGTQLHIKNTDIKSAEKYKNALKKVKEKHKESKIETKYDLEKLILEFSNGDNLDYFYLGYYLNELKNDD